MNDRLKDITMALTHDHMRLLLDSAITREVISASGIKSSLQGIEFPWSDGVGPTVWQIRPDKPRVNDDGKPVKYLFAKGAKIPFNRLRDSDTSERLIIAEGTKQQYAVLSHAPADFAVYGMSGCWGWKNADLSVVDGRAVFLLLDADIDTNPDVWAAADQMTKQLKLHGAKSVAYVATTGTGKEGVDDVLASLPEDRRAHMMRTWLASAPVKMPKRPRAKRPEPSGLEADAAKLFRVRDKPVAFQPDDAAKRIMAGSPIAMTAEGDIAFYRNGVFEIDPYAVLTVVTGMLGNYYAPSYLKTTSDVLMGYAIRGGLTLPERMPAPLLNCPNGMVDLRTGELGPHDPKHLSYVQVGAAYEPAMATPVYEAWLRQSLRQEGATDADLDALVADIEETAGTMLDPTRTPSKALFLFGPSRSGKSTFLRLLKAIAGARNTSAVTLHNMAKDTFATANLYGKMLNVAADLSNEHVADLSNFKLITGEDEITANRKYGSQFTFTNQALIAFSANELPTVSEASRAYAERMKPFNFPNSFAGREDKSIEAKLMAELPGILARWVKAYGRHLERRGYAATDAATRTEFEAKSDRVVQFFQDMCTLTEARYGQTLADDLCTQRRRTSELFNAWAERNGGSKMGERAFFQRLAQIEGVTEVKTAGRSRAYNLTVRKSDDDSWDDNAAALSDEPVADPIPSGLTDANPWNSAAEPLAAAESTVSLFLAPQATDPVEEPEAGDSGFLSFNGDYFN